MTNNALSGSSPAETQLLTNLQSLKFNLNNLQGSIPTEVALLTNAQEILLYNTEFTEIFLSELSKMKNLLNLHLGGSKLNGKISNDFIVAIE